MKRLLTYPDKITIVTQSKLQNVCDKLGIEVTNDINSNFDLAIYWNKNPDQLPDQKLIEVSKRIKVINIGCTCVLKGFVDKAWELASGYSITINPMNPSEEYYVRKSQLQWMSHTGEVHDGRVFREPQQPDNKYVYQKLIDTEINTKDGILYRALRVPVFGKNIPCLYVKDHAHRFKGGVGQDFVKIIYDKTKYISQEEIDIILKFCEITGVDYAEIDLLRDNESKLLYAVDINNGAGDGISNMVSKKVAEKLKTILAETFKKEFL